MSKMLGNLDRWLEKTVAFAEARKFDPNTLLHARLAPDMFPLSRQIQSACDGAKFLAARTSGKEPPKHPDDETTVEQLRARIANVREYLAGFSPEDFSGAEARVVPLGFMPGKGLSAEDFAREMSIPNTYFHLVTAYAILRHNGVDLGKGDYLGRMNIRDA
jgi:hypothetical protein